MIRFSDFPPLHPVWHVSMAINGHRPKRVTLAVRAETAIDAMRAGLRIATKRHPRPAEERGWQILSCRPAPSEG